MDFKGYQALVEGELQTLPENGRIPQKLLDAMGYSLLSGGKRLRPVLLLAAYGLKHDEVKPALKYAAALEMIHAYSLVHDDLPAMDNDDLRRGKPTNHKVFGEGMAILAGDGLLNLAYETMLGASLHAENPANAIAAMEAIARRAGVTGMVAGQTLDIAMEGQTPTEACLSYIHEHKTADLITAALEGGLRLAGAADDEVMAGIAYGFHLGMAFQMVDDLLDILGDEAVIGKKTGQDDAHGKMTWPALKGVEMTRAEAAEHVDLAVEAIKIFKNRGKFLETLAKTTLERVQ